MKLIEVNELLNAIYTDFSEHYSDRDSLSLFNLIKEEIEEQPIIDAEPVKHGHWISIKEPNPYLVSYKCSLCGREVSVQNPNWIKWNFPYCHCGAKMFDFYEEEK